MQFRMRSRGMQGSFETSAPGAMSRLTPIPMTVSVTAVGMLLQAIRTHPPGQEIQGLMAIVILGGLFILIGLTLVDLAALARVSHGSPRACQGPTPLERPRGGAQIAVQTYRYKLLLPLAPCEEPANLL